TPSSQLSASLRDLLQARLQDDSLTELGRRYLKASLAGDKLNDDARKVLLDHLSSDLSRQTKEAFWQPLKSYLRGVTQLSLIPHGDLLHTLPYELTAPEGMRLRVYPGLLFYAQAQDLERTCNLIARPNKNAPIGLRVHPAEETNAPLLYVNAEAELVREAWKHVDAAVLDPADVTQASPPWGAFHAASHGDLAPQQPGSAYLLLGTGEHLDLMGVLAMPHRPQLVFLSACVVGRLQEDPDGDPLGLITAFFLKGARYVIASLIPVPDEYMPLLSMFFHQAWQAGLNPEDALTEAKRRLREQDWDPETVEQVIAAYARAHARAHGIKDRAILSEIKTVYAERISPQAVAEYINKEHDFLPFIRGYGHG
ncbi:MAG: CHAT domain-containing protein, partial [Chloroflexia bacterium]|nr:CHAT domain-containing protein [Chloroflexia bacterium]